MAQVRTGNRGHGYRFRLDAWSVVVFLVPATKFIRLPFGGQLMGPELLLLLLAPLLVLTSGKRLLQPFPAAVFTLALIWLGAQIVSDFVNQTPVSDLMRGWAKIAFISIDFAALYLLLYGRLNRLIIFAAGLVVGALLEFFLNPTELGAVHPWKFGLAMPFSIAALIVSVLLNGSAAGRLVSVCLLLAMAALHFYLDFRSLAGMLVLVVAVQLAPIGGRRRVALSWAQELRRAVVVLLLLGLAGAGTLTVYTVAVEGGVLGEVAAYRYERQASGAYGLLLGGRSEILASSRAIIDAPLLGHGSWAKDCRYTDLLFILKSELGYGAVKDDGDCKIPSHSHVFGAWVEAGIVGAVFWLSLMVLPIRALILVSMYKPRVTPLAAFFAILLAWDLMFSPYGGELRYRTPYEIVFMMTVIALFDAKRAVARTMKPFRGRLAMA